MTQISEVVHSSYESEQERLIIKDRRHVQLNCAYCGKQFEVPLCLSIKRKNCSMGCRQKSFEARRVNVSCAICGKSFIRTISKLAKGGRDYCSLDCYKEAQKGGLAYYNPWLKGKTLAEVVGEESALKIKQRMSEGRKGKRSSITTEFKKGHTPWWIVRGEKNPSTQPRISQKIAKATKSSWTDPTYIKKQMAARQARPNHQERFMSKVFPFLEYVGDGSLVIGRKVPDFKVRGQQKLVELFGNYWHDEAEELERITYFRKNNWGCLVIWNSDLINNFNEVKERLEEFISK